MFLRLVRLRIQRGLSLLSLGPNETRIAYDISVGYLALLGAGSFALAFHPQLVVPFGGSWPLLLAPIVLVGVNTIMGIYSRLRMAPSGKKAAVLLCSTICTCGIEWLLTANGAFVVLWALLTYGPLALARLLLGLPYTKHRTLRRVSVNRRGPILVIGGAGYIGSHVTDLLLEKGEHVRVLDRLMYGRSSLKDFLGHPRFELVEGDVTDITKLTLAMRDAAAAVHLAGLVGDPACALDTNFTRHANIVATRLAKDVAQSLGIHRFVFASSCSVYGVSDREVSETDRLNPVSLYAQTKIDSENELLFSVRDDFFVTILRFATVFGHSRRPRFDLVANLFAAQAMTDGLLTVVGPSQWRPFIHVRDVARGVVQVLAAPPVAIQSQVFNVGDKRLNMTILQLAETIRSATSKYKEVTVSIHDNPGDRRNYAVRFDKIQSSLNFQASITVEEGVREMVEHFLKGAYQDYRQEIYSNVAMTKKALDVFQDPFESANLYTPLRLSAARGTTLLRT